MKIVYFAKMEYLFVRSYDVASSRAICKKNIFAVYAATM